MKITPNIKTVNSLNNFFIPQVHFLFGNDTLSSTMSIAIFQQINFFKKREKFIVYQNRTKTVSNMHNAYVNGN